MALLQLWGGGCATRTPPLCGLLPGQPESGGTIVVALTEPVDPAHAPSPQNDSERLLFSHIYETLVEADCQGELRPGLAESWSSSEEETVWTFKIREGAVFSDGTPVLASDVQRAWVDNRQIDQAEGRTLPWSLYHSRYIEGLEEQKVVITLGLPTPDLPHLLAHPSFGVGVTRSGSDIPIGSGPCRIVSWKAKGDVDIVCSTNELHPDPTETWDRLTFRIREGWDPRDLSAVGADLLITRKMEGIEYFKELGYRVTPLEWDRNYLLMVPDPPDREASLTYTVGLDREDLARKAIVSDGRPSFQIERPYRTAQDIVRQPFHDRLMSYGTTETGPAGFKGTILYLEGDIDGRLLAERIAADLSAHNFPNLGGVKAASKLREEFLKSLHSGTDLAYVFPFALDHLGGTSSWLPRLTRMAPWLPLPSEYATPQELTDYVIAEGAIVPLVLTRPHLVCRPELSGGRTNGLGLPRLKHVGWRKGSEKR